MPRGQIEVLPRALIALIIFLGAFLLFAVEPMIAKIILPWFGGSAAVWLACLMFFQIALLGGYSYAHLLTTHMAPSQQWRVHLVLLALSIALLPIVPSEAWKPVADTAPLLRIVMLLAVTIGLPFLILAASGPLLQAWISQASVPSPSVYRLYALSNLASLAALLGYPVFIEPSLTLMRQAWVWSGAYLCFVTLSAAITWRLRTTHSDPVAASAPEARAKRSAWIMWLALAAVPSALLLSVSHHITRNIAAMPLLWVVPLVLYLLSFIIAFDHTRWFYRPLWYGLLPAAVGTMILAIAAPFLFGSYGAQLAIYASAFFVCCMICHGELAAGKPAPPLLTSYYLAIAGGGAIGGLGIAAVAPVLFARDNDLAIVLVLLTGLVAILARKLPSAVPAWVRRNAMLLLLGAWPALAMVVIMPLQGRGYETLRAVRNFYGALQVQKIPASATHGEFQQLQDGNITHGREFTSSGERCRPLTYYGPLSGVGAAIRKLAAEGPLHVGIVGLGAGTIAGYARDGDKFRFYEINPLVRDIATRDFQYLACSANWNIVMGDGRLSLERESENNFDILAIDAFSSDAIPVHLLTREAFALYWRHLKPSGILAIHVSNTFVDLVPVVARAAAEQEMAARVLRSAADDANGISQSVWVLVAENESIFADPILKDAEPITVAGDGRVWSDDYSNLWRALRW